MQKIDSRIFIPAYTVLLITSMTIIKSPGSSYRIITSVQDYILQNFGFLFIWYGLFAIGFVLWVSFSIYGKIKLGDQEEEPEFSLFSWASMLFCSGIGAGLVYWGAIEWAYYFSEPPLGVEAGTYKAAELAVAYGLFHWGPTAWAMYAISACSVGYLFYVRKTPILKISEACRGLLGKWVDGILGSIIDIVFLLGLIGATATSLGIGAPLATKAFAHVLNIKVSLQMELIIIGVITLLFTLSTCMGLKKGIRILSDTNIVLGLILVGTVFIGGNTLFMLNMGTTSIGVVFQKFPTMMTWLDPYGQSMFPQKWTVFYWAWWGAYAPFMGMFIAKISRGRTIRNMLLGVLTYGSAGCFVFFSVLGNFGLNLQMTGEMDVVGQLKKTGGHETIISVFSRMPMGEVVVIIIAFISIIFIATTFDSVSYVLAAVSQKEIKQDEDPHLGLRLVWALSLAFIPIGFILMGSPLNILQSSSIIAALPVSIIVIITAMSFIKMVRADVEAGRIDLSKIDSETNLDTKE